MSDKYAHYIFLIRQPLLLDNAGVSKLFIEREKLERIMEKQANITSSAHMYADRGDISHSLQYLQDLCKTLTYKNSFTNSYLGETQQQNTNAPS